MYNSEETKMAQLNTSTEVITAFNRIPYALINKEVEGSAKDTLEELTEICKYYKIYKNGASFTPEGSNGDYVSADLKYRMSASLIKKEARFLFAATPDIVFEPKGDTDKITEESKNALTVMNDVLKSVLDENKFEDILIKAAKDCFIGKRVACLVNFNEEDGVTITFVPSTQFIYDTKMGNTNIIKKFVCFLIVKESITLSEKRIFEKKFVLEDNGKVYLEETLYDGAGRLLEEITPYQETLLNRIPVSIIVNDGLTGETFGESEIKILQPYEGWYSKLSNADIDAERKSMNPIRYTVDMDSNSTKNLSGSAGSKWDLGSDQNLAEAHPMVGILESSMNYSGSLDSTLKRIKTTAYEEIDMPNITLESMQGAITSGKSLKAIYWPLITRCREKMKSWGPQLSQMADIIIQGALVYPACVEKYTSVPVSPVAYEIKVEQNFPLLEDEIEEKTMDLSEVESQVMSKKTYMKKWRDMTDREVEEELAQIALERQILEDSAVMPTQKGLNTDDSKGFSDDSVPAESEEEISENEESNVVNEESVEDAAYDTEENVNKEVE